MAIDRQSVEQLRVMNHHYCTFSSEIAEQIAAHGNPDALAIWVYLINKPSNWSVRQTEVQDRLSGLSRRRYAEAIKVLKVVGVMKLVSVRRKNGEMAGSELLVSNVVIEVSPNIPVTDMSVDRPVGERYDLTIDEVITIDEGITKKDMSESDDPNVSDSKNADDDLPDDPPAKVRRNNYPEEFERLWALFDKRDKKTVAFVQWKKLSPDSDLLETMIAALTRERDWRTRVGVYGPNPRGGYGPHGDAPPQQDPDRWIKNERWTDETPETGNGKQQSAHHGLAEKDYRAGIDPAFLAELEARGSDGSVNQRQDQRDRRKPERAD